MKRIKPLLAISAMLMVFSSCDNKNKVKATKIAVFADCQLTDKLASGATEYSLPYFKNHLELCKQEDVDVIVIPGDLVNNAVETFYKKVNSIIKEVYGEDESKLPEFVYSMGNHEWYTNESSEKEDPKAIKLFKKYARIDSPNLVKQSESYVVNQDNTSANYYKVINGIPFVSVSCTNNSGMLLSDEISELESWFNEISKLKSVKNGGPIYVAYHYPIQDLTYSYGQGASRYSESIDNILSKYPQVVLFTGDSHFSAVNERTINQVNYTNINVGSSCYSRHVSYGANRKYDEHYYNMKGTTKDQMIGEVAENYNRTPHIHIIDVDEKGNAIYNRYFTTEDPKNPTKLGLTWEIPANITKDKFIYTNARFNDKTWANKMYGKDGLIWNEGTELKVQKGTEQTQIVFPDVTDFHYCEHYLVEITGESTNKYDFVSNYYKWETEPHINHFAINNFDLPTGTSFDVKITAFDYFDNPSLNNLTIHY